MKTAVAIDSRWLKTFMSISKQEINNPSRIDSNIIDSHLRATCDGMDNKRILSEIEKKFSEQRKSRLLRMQPLFASQPRLEKICKDWKNDFVDSGFTAYNFPEPINDSFQNEEDDLQYLINVCGCNLTRLNLYHYPNSQMMQLIKSKCPNLRSLLLRFKEVKEYHFDDVFSNMAHLETLIIHWPRKDSTLPMTLIKSLKQVRGTLKTFYISCQRERTNSHDERVATVLSPETKTLMDVISNMTNLESVTIFLDHGFTDKFFINLTNTCKNLKSLCIRSSSLTDKGLITVNNLNRLENFDLGLFKTGTENKFITDRSIRWLSNNNLESLVISNCIQVTNLSIIKLIENLPNLRSLNIENTKATMRVVKEIAKLTKDRKLSLSVYVSFKIPNFFLEVNHAVKFYSPLRK